jgi:hypothetical protein
MKKMIAMVVALAGLWIVGCQKDNSGVTPSVESTTLESVVSAAARYSVTTDSVTVGKCKGKLTEIAAADLSTAISAYINSTYAGATVKFAAKDAEGKVIVAIVLTDGTVKGLLFNADGTFNAELKQHAAKAKLTKIEASALPAAITSYISTTYAGAEIKQAGKNAAGEYFVGILVDSKIKVLLFKADGTFNKELEKPEFAPGHPGKPGNGGKH